VSLTKQTINKILYDTEKATIIALDKEYNSKNHLGRKGTLYHSNSTGFFITVETINKGETNHIEPIDELAAREHYKLRQQKRTNFPKQARRPKNTRQDLASLL